MWLVLFWLSISVRFATTPTDPAEKKWMSSGEISTAWIPFRRFGIPSFGQSSGDGGKADRVTRIVIS